MVFGIIFIRRRAWWYNKVPLSVMLFLVLVDGRPLTYRAVLALCGLIGVVCCVANFGYALNEIFDLAEDRRVGRSNVASEMSNTRVWTIISFSAIIACSLAAWLAGSKGLILTACELLLPAAYSVPPLRLKEREWLGVFADAGAAHVFPALLALLIVSKHSLGVLPMRAVLIVVLWALVTGLRGILSHQLQSEDQDRAAGLFTVVHRIGHARLKSFIVFAILPIELISFGAFVLQTDATPFLRVVACVYVIYELIKFRFQVFSIVVFHKAGQRYIPFVDEGFYKVWGPIAIAIDAALKDPFYLVFVPLCTYAFWPRVSWEKTQITLTAKTVFAYRSHLRTQTESITGPVG